MQLRAQVNVHYFYNPNNIQYEGWRGVLHARRNRSGRSGHGPTKISAKHTFFCVVITVLVLTNSSNAVSSVPRIDPGMFGPV